MSDTYESTRRNRVYKRKFDHDEMLERRRNGETIEALAKRYGVSSTRISQLTNPEVGRRAAQRIVSFNRSFSHHCATCGTPITKGAVHSARNRGIDSTNCGQCRRTPQGPYRNQSSDLHSILNDLNRVLANIVNDLKKRSS